MFYNLKILFFTILYLMSLILVYFIDKQIMLTGIFKNPFIFALIIWSVIILLSAGTVFLLLFILKKTINLFLKLFKKEEINNNGFFVWLSFTLLSYVAVFIIFVFSIKY